MRLSLFLPLLKRLAVVAGWPLVLFTCSAVAAPTTPTYVQSNYAVPQTAQTAVTVPYTAAQTTGNLNVVIVGWNDSAAHVSSLKDSKGNVYQLAVGPMVTGTLSQAIYYAKRISAAAAATNAVTVTFSTAAAYADIRIIEYSGIDPVNALDTFVGATGNGSPSSSGAVKTTNAMDLLVGANTVQTLTAGAGTGFTRRLLTNPDGDIAEDQIVTATGSYSASAPLGPPGGWVMQMVAFRATALPTPTPAPTPTPKPTPAPTPAAAPTPTSATPSFVQGNYAVPQASQTVVMVPYTAAQIAGDLNVVIVGWNDTTAHVSSVTDSNGNGYQLATGPTAITGSLSQAIYYAKNIFAAKAGANTVAINFNTSGELSGHSDLGIQRD
jgi:hypothetical protein